MSKADERRPANGSSMNKQQWREQSAASGKSKGFEQTWIATSNKSNTEATGNEQARISTDCPCVSSPWDVPAQNKL